ncbi:hypothetical protein AKJ46_00090 [candidate division MSBL1 archaeon SCGC-AAA833K04]|uniref:DUF6036 domain-containing protein n=1 Tax=candidate division MSBL1 archaeon SCGC-AAA833K04 TaxID=1698258 RepID=A0A133VT13_9EURY|nr:hypothetical protein AKJ46_00090 [candidate division MSBL1 archaeon SCGC-AAA833K04]
MEFWSDQVIEKSWRVLLELNKKFDFILIGGWAVYLYTKAIKSKDIDLVADYQALEEIKVTYDLKKNSRLKKYEVIVDEISVDVYVPYFSELPLPAEDLESYTRSVEGLSVLAPEALLILKQGAEMERSHSVKGQKDRTDILNLLVNGSVDFRRYNEILLEYGLKEYGERLVDIVRNAKKEFSYLGIENLRKRKLLRDEIIEDIKRA